MSLNLIMQPSMGYCIQVFKIAVP